MSKTYDVVLLTATGSFPYTNRSAGTWKIAYTLRNSGYSVFVVDFFPELWARGVLLKILDRVIGENTLFMGFGATNFSKVGTSLTYKEKKGRTAPGITTWPLEDDEMVNIISHVKTKNPKLKVAYGAPYSKTRAEDFDLLKTQGVDFGVFGFGEDKVLEIAYDIKQSRNMIATTANFDEPKLFITDKETPNYDFRNQVAHPLEDDLFKENDIMPIEMARGCIFKCTYCNFEMKGKSSKDTKHIRTPESVRDEMMKNYELFGVTDYLISDDTFNDSTQKLIDLRDMIKTLPFEPSFWSYIRADLIASNPIQMTLLAEIGVTRIVLGLETLDRKSGRLVGKGGDPKKLLNMCKELKATYANMNKPLIVQSGVIIGLPNDTRESIESWIGTFIETNDYVDCIAPSVLYLMEGTEIYENALDVGYIPSKTKEDLHKYGQWRNDHWSQIEAREFTDEIIERDRKIGVSSVLGLGANSLMTLGYTLQEIKDNPPTRTETMELAKDYFEEYIFDILDFLDSKGL